MAVNKEELFKDFLAQKQKKSEERQQEIVKDNVSSKRKNNKKNRFKSNKSTVQNINETIEKKEEAQNIEESAVIENIKNIQDEKFLQFKDLFLSNQIVKDFMVSLNLYRERGFHMFDDNEYFIKAKYEHPNCRVVIVEPSLSDLTVGKSGHVYIVKPMYKKEYTTFQKLFGDRATHHEEFITYSLLQCTLYPENITENDIEKMGAGTIITLYNTISNLSDFNKNFTVVEV